MTSIVTNENICEANEKILHTAAAFATSNQKENLAPIFIIVPDRATLQAEKILTRHAPCLLNVRVVTFSMLYAICQNDTHSGNNTPTVLDKTTAVLFMWRAIQEVRDGLVYFGPSVGQYAFAEKMFNTVNQLESSRADFITLEKNAKTTVTKRKMHDISMIHKKYKELCKGYIDGSGMLG